MEPGQHDGPGGGARLLRGGRAVRGPDPGHSFQEIRQQIFGSDDASGPARMDGFVQQAPGEEVPPPRQI